MTRAEEIIKQLDLNFDTLVKDVAWNLKPKDFLCKASILLIDCGDKYQMLLMKNDDIITEIEFIEVGNITNNYSYLYNYDKNNLKTKTRNETSSSID